MIYLVYFGLFSVCIAQNRTAPVRQQLELDCTLQLYNGFCIKQPEYMKRNCPDVCEDFSTSTFICKDDPTEDCEALKRGGYCTAEHSLHSDHYCPRTCNSCPEAVLANKPPTFQLNLPLSSFSKHMYIEEPYDESSSDLISLSTQDWKILDSTMNLVNIEMGADGDANVVTNCRDNNADCAGMVSMGYCDDYPVWTSQNCARSCGDCDGKRSAAILKETEHLLRDGDGSGCVDLQADCFERIREGNCLRGDLYMTQECRRSCRLCHPKKPDPDIDQAHFNVLMILRQRNGMNNQQEYKTASGKCTDTNLSCRVLKRKYGCEKNKPYMYTQCARTCRTCTYFDDSKRCSRKFLNISEAPAFGPGEMGQMFRNLKLKFGHRFNITYLSTSPWVVTIDNFISDEEINAMMNGVSRWYDIQGEEYLRDFDLEPIGDARGGGIGWCFGECDRASRSVLERMKLLTSVPIHNVESFQMLEYSKSNHHYVVHHDFYPKDVDAPAGNRVLSFFMYLSDVEEGGETEFPKLGIKIRPKKGRAAMWVNSLDADPYVKDIRTDHQGNPPIKGIKYAANVGIHMYDIRTSNAWGCGAKI